MFVYIMCILCNNMGSIRFQIAPMCKNKTVPGYLLPTRSVNEKTW